jgi:hypothetical protein
LSKSRAKGTLYENLVRDHFQEKGWPETERLEFSSPLGDLTGSIVMECKSTKALSLSTWIEQARKASGRASKPFVVIHKRAQKHVSQSYVTTELEQFLPFLRAYEYCRENGIDLNQ